MQFLEEILNIIESKDRSIARISKESGVDVAKLYNYVAKRGKPKTEDSLKLQEWLEKYKGNTRKKEQSGEDKTELQNLLITSNSQLVSSNHKLIESNYKLVDSITNSISKLINTTPDPLIQEQTIMLRVLKSFLHEYVIGKMMKEADVLSALDRLRNEIMAETLKADMIGHKI